MTYEVKTFDVEESQNIVFYSRPMAMLISSYFPHFKTVKRVMYLDNGQTKFEMNLNNNISCLFLSDSCIKDEKINKEDFDKYLV